MACTIDFSGKKVCCPDVPGAFMAKCYPDMLQQHRQQQQVQLPVTVDAHPGADSSPAGGNEAAAATISCKSSSIRAGLQFSLVGAGLFLRRYAGHTITGMSGVRGSTQLTLHLQSPAAAAAAAAQQAAAAAAAAQQAAAAAAAAAEAGSACWQEHELRYASAAHP
ncbi:hypothetical protein OEZ86_004567 [Tetradesmus obliquus]|nr:hypothetical protein OEZ86_004567 [Tetradesmus obliquus]